MTLPFTFLRETKEELEKVVWPGRREVVRLTTLVIVVSIIVGLFIGGLDFLFTKAISLLLQ